MDAIATISVPDIALNMGINANELNVARQHLLDNVIEYFLAKEGVEALYIQGSVAAESTDEYSDIDFRVVVQQDVYQQYLSERFAAPQQWGDWLYNEWADRSWVCVSHFKPFNKIDVLYFKPNELQPSPWFLLPVRVIYDPQNWVGAVIQASQDLTFTLDIGEVDRLISKGLAYAEEVYRRIMREEFCYAQSLLDSFRSILMQFDDYCRNSPSTSAPASHFERRGSRSCVEALISSYTPSDRKLLIRALLKLLGLYHHQIIQLYQAFDLQRDITTDLGWINTIHNLCIEQMERYLRDSKDLSR